MDARLQPDLAAGTEIQQHGRLARLGDLSIQRLNVLPADEIDHHAHPGPGIAELSPVGQLQRAAGLAVEAALDRQEPGRDGGGRLRGDFDRRKDLAERLEIAAQQGFGLVEDVAGGA